MKSSTNVSLPTTKEILTHVLEGMMITDADGTIKAVNPTFCQVTGYKAEDVIGKNPRLLKSGKHTKTFYRRLWNTLQKNGVWKGEITNRKKNGDLYTEWLTISAIKNKDNKITHYLGVFTDISKRKQAEEMIRHMAYYDPLTDLPNRALFLDRLKHALAQAQRSKSLLAVLFLDLDRVKIVNDTLGHGAGDELLKRVAARLKSTLREGDTVARMSGDEFMVILPGMEHSEDITKISEKVLECLKPPFQFGRHEISITASIGISVFPFDGKDAETLSRNADTAMYRAKQLGRNNFQIFTPAMKQEGFEQLAIGNNLKRAFDQGEFLVHYQPQIDMTSGKIIAMEALVRWQHPKLGTVSPSRFIKWAEESGLILPIGDWVMEQACKQSRAWRDSGFPHLRMAVNLSARQFTKDGLVENIANLLKEYRMDPESLELELTESVIMDNPQKAIEISHQLRAMGIRFSIDDFGTGYSSLNYLKRLPVNSIKMDQTFVRDLASDPSDKAIAKAVIDLGHGLNLSVIAEGVETETQRDLLRTYECDVMQGFLFSPPRSAEALETVLKENQPFSEKTLFAPN